MILPEEHVWDPTLPKLQRRKHTLWLFDIAMGNAPCLQDIYNDYPIKNSGFTWLRSMIKSFWCWPKSFQFLVAISAATSDKGNQTCLMLFNIISTQATTKMLPSYSNCPYIYIYILSLYIYCPYIYILSLYIYIYIDATLIITYIHIQSIVMYSFIFSQDCWWWKLNFCGMILATSTTIRAGWYCHVLLLVQVLTSIELRNAPISNA